MGWRSPAKLTPSPPQATQAPAWQLSLPGQAAPHAPQFAALVWVSTHTPPQRVCPDPQSHTPPTQARPEAQTTPHAPQFMGSLVTSPQLHAPATQLDPAGQALAQLPQ